MTSTVGDQPLSSPPKATRRLPKAVTAAAFFDVNSLKRVRPQAETDQDSSSPPARLRQRHSHHHPSDAAAALNPLHAPYRTFKTQQAAFNFLDKQSCRRILRTFATETAASGQREFIVTSAQLFWDKYTQLPAQQRHCYEIIRQATPCNLYFDLEFSPECNPGVDGPRLVQLLVSGVRELLQEAFGVLLQEQHVLELDSSTAIKFSRHLIFHLPRLAFADACHAGRFARCVLLRLLARGAHSSAHAQLLVRTKEGGLTTFVDMGVYTRNRAFRLYLSSKFGKAAVLRLTHRYGGASRCPKAAFHDCLVSVLHTPGCYSNTSSSNSGMVTSSSSAGRSSAQRGCCAPSTPSHTRTSGGSTARLSLLYMDDEGQQELLLRALPEAWQQLPMLQLRPLPHPQPSNPAAAAAPPPLPLAFPLSHAAPSGSGRGGQQQHQLPLPAAAWSQPCYGPSPFPELDAFISQVCCVGGVQGGIRSWLLQGQEQRQGQWQGQQQQQQQGRQQGQGQGQEGPRSSVGLVDYNIKGNRWCGNVGRAHKSNGIYLCVDLAAGVYYQKCYDPECRHYRSNYMPLPPHIWQAYKHLAAQPEQQQQQELGPQHLQQQQQQQQPWQWQQQAHSLQHQQQQQAASAAAAEADEDEECLRVLLACEEQQHLHHHHLLDQQQQQRSAIHPGSCRVALPAHAGAGACAVGGAGGGAGAGGDGDEVVSDDDELCWQLLQDMEQQQQQATALQRRVAAG